MKVAITEDKSEVFPTDKDFTFRTTGLVKGQNNSIDEWIDKKNQR